MKRVIQVLIIVLIMLPFVCAAADSQVQITADKANIRERPASDSPILLTVKKDTLLKLLGKSGTWYRVELPNGKSSGYVHNSLAQMTEGIAPVAQVAPIAQAAAPTEAPQALPKAAKASAPKKSSPAKKSMRSSSTYKKMYLTALYNLALQEETVSIDSTSTIYFETASFNTAYAAVKGNSFGGSIGYRLSPALAIEVGADIGSRDLTSTTTASIPHPLWEGNPRSGEVSYAGKLKENSFFMNLVYSLQLKPLVIQLSAGGTYVMAQADIVSDLTYTETAYPYTELTITQVMAQLKQNVFGFNAGIAIGYSFTDSLSLIINARYIGAKAVFAQTPEEDTGYPTPELTLGGIKVGGGIQISF